MHSVELRHHVKHGVGGNRALFGVGLRFLPVIQMIRKDATASNWPDNDKWDLWVPLPNKIHKLIIITLDVKIDATSLHHRHHDCDK